jgi:hypothetical protein
MTPTARKIATVRATTPHGMAAAQGPTVDPIVSLVRVRQKRSFLVRTIVRQQAAITLISRLVERLGAKECSSSHRVRGGGEHARRLRE